MTHHNHHNHQPRVSSRHNHQSRVSSQVQQADEAYDYWGREAVSFWGHS